MFCPKSKLNALLFGLILLFLHSCKSESTKSTEKDNKATATIVNAHTPQTALVWNSIEDLDKLMAKEKKKVLIDFYTGWCKWCKVMDKETFTNPKVTAFLAENYHLIKFDAEQKAPATYKGKEYIFKPNKGRGGVNGLAENLLSGRMSYPSLVFLNQNMEKVKVSRGYLKPDQLMNELKQL